ncbi:MAG: hypothetical protein ACJ8F7_19060 [Gemmataceae bacterium]
MANAKINPVINAKVGGRHCHVLLKGDNNAFDATSKVTSITDDHGGEWTAVKVTVKGKNNELLHIEMTCKTVPKDVLPDSGTITITVNTNNMEPMPPVDPVSVDYTNEP